MAHVAISLLVGMLVPLEAAAAETVPPSPALVLEAEAAQPYYRENAANEIFVQARVLTGSPAGAPRADAASADAASSPAASPRNVAFVLDRSGSMDGERMLALQDAVASAMASLAATDTVAVVLFGSEVETVIEAQPCAEARERFARLLPLEAAGGAALYDAVSQGAAQVRRLARPDSWSHLIVVTDGLATKGPRELDDLVRLTETIARDGIVVSTIGLGDEFNEDLLAAMARTGGGRFSLAPDSSHLGEVLAGAVPAARAIIGADAVLTLEYRSICDDVTAHGAPTATVARNTVTKRFARLAAGQDLSLLASGVLDAFGTIGIQRDLVRARLEWTDPATGERRELTQGVTIRFSTDPRDLVRLYNIRVYRAASSALISAALQKAIEALDRGDPRGAVRELRRGRERVRDVNFEPKDDEIAAMLARLDAYIAEVQQRGFGPLDRKILRSGLLGRFEMPIPDAEDARP